MCELQAGIHSFFKNIIIYYFVKGVTDILDFSKKKIELLQSKRKIVLSTCPSDRHCIKFGCPKSKSSCPKSFFRLKEMKCPRCSKAKRNIYPYFVKYENCFYDYDKFQFYCNLKSIYLKCLCIFLLKNVLVPSTIYVRGLHVQTKIIISTCPGQSDRGVGAPCISISLWALNSKYLVKRYHYQTY